jgi:hypothetical protein
LRFYVLFDHEDCPSHSSKQSYEEYQKRMSKLIKVPIKFSDVLEARAARKKENLSSTSADGDKKYVEFKCPLDPDGGHGQRFQRVQNVREST